ncbi:hypothetical protein DLAC_01036 [Tieghemostelium lacteum]|uniref:Uncharacterized protein n=1 Tax=Tieghemostelium lacteum TaxID=361077 RepID=A0A152A7N2_TIELA|nr:hypothetical protein DLAC_01036 [Tieghemostelium lacteum]|eukprot:KYR02216.1 hypothetical protein DLAC_01036 [Tieghemostelium lacteum]
MTYPELTPTFPNQNIILDDGKNVIYENGDMYPFQGSGARFYKSGVNPLYQDGGLRLGPNEKIFKFDGSYANGVHLQSGQNVYNSGGTPLNNFISGGVVFNNGGIHLQAGQNVYDVDGVPLDNSSPPLDTNGVTFQSDGIHLQSGQNIFDSNGEPIDNSAPPLDTRYNLPTGRFTFGIRSKYLQ